jgi:peptidoglycan/xylan/chitin deacetylase (PgdA/CDA1 family)
VNDSRARLLVLMYHYVRDVRTSPFPGLHALGTAAFRSQVDQLRERYEMASLETCLAFVRGEYLPVRDLCLLTFDDGLCDHYEEVTPVLAEREIEGVFLLPTGPIEEHFVLPAHKAHFLAASLGFDEYEERLLPALKERERDLPDQVDPEAARTAYRWDEPRVANFKYLVNRVVNERARNEALGAVFTQVFGSESDFARSLYLSWDRALAMQRAGMILGGHTHTHPVLAACTVDAQRRELEQSLALLERRLAPQASWPFAFPFGKRQTFDEHSVALLGELGYGCAFTTEVGWCHAGDPLHALCRVDPKDVPALVG